MRWGSRLHALLTSAPMKHDQFTLPFLDTTIVAEGFGLYGGFPTAKSSAQAQMNFKAEEDEALDAPVPTQPSLPAQDYRLAGDRRLAEGWKARAEDNLAAIRLMDDDRGRRPSRATGRAGAAGEIHSLRRVDLADKLFRRAGERFRARLGRSRRRTRSGSSRARISRTSSGPPNTPTTRRSS